MNNEIFEKIQQKAKKLGVVVDFSPKDIIDFEHLDSVWYYGRDRVASIAKKVYGQQYELLIVPSGEIEAYGKIEGKEVEFKGKEIDRLRVEYGFDDEKLQEYSVAFASDDCLNWEYTNCFGGQFAIDDNMVSVYDEILDFDIFDVFSDLESLVELLDDFIQNARICKLKGEFQNG